MGFRRIGMGVAFTFAAAAFASTSAAQGDQWHLGSNSHDQIAFVRQSQVTRNADDVTFWVLIVLRRPQNIGVPKQVAYYLMHEQIDCRAERAHWLSVTSYASNGSSIVTGGASEWADVIPETNNSLMEDAACHNHYIFEDIAGSIDEARALADKYFSVHSGT